jgi:SPP1 family predicted phage head-tail adaptor
MSKVCSLGCVKMDKRLVIQSISRTSDDQGGYTESWATLATVWGQLKPVKGYERFQLQQNMTPVTHDAIIRYRDDVTTRNRITYDSRTFHIKEVLNVDEANVYLKIKVVELV